ncbi:MAG: hypothetical protein JSU65_08700, partial [Candidatus Zixiibacteriota bacterium]
VDFAEVYIGDLITYTIAITYDSSYQLVPPPLGAHLGAFDVKDYEPDIEEILPDGRRKTQTVFKLTTFTTGDYTIPAMPLIFTLPDSTRHLVLAEPVPIKILSLLSDTGDSLDIRPLKAQHEFEGMINPYYLWGGMALAIIVTLIIIWFVRRRRKKTGELIDLRDPWEIAFEKLAVLKQRNLPDSESYKLYYFELTEIAREYLGKMYEVDVLEMTTGEFLESFEEITMPDGHYDKTIRFLMHADLVKFARHVPERQRLDADFDLVHGLVESVRSEFERRRAVDGSQAAEPVSAAAESREKVA